MNLAVNRKEILSPQKAFFQLWGKLNYFSMQQYPEESYCKYVANHTTTADF